MIPGAISDFYLETQIDDQTPAGQFFDPDVLDVAAIIMRRNASLVRAGKASVLVVPPKMDAAAFDEPDSWRQMVELLYPKHGGPTVRSQEDNEVLSGGPNETEEEFGIERNDAEGTKEAKEEGKNNDMICTFCLCPNVWTESAVQRARREMKWFVDLPGLHNKTVKFRCGLKNSY